MATFNVRLKHIVRNRNPPQSSSHITSESTQIVQRWTTTHTSYLAICFNAQQFESKVEQEYTRRLKRREMKTASRERSIVCFIDILLPFHKCHPWTWNPYISSNLFTVHIWQKHAAVGLFRQRKYCRISYGWPEHRHWRANLENLSLLHHPSFALDTRNTDRDGSRNTY